LSDEELHQQNLAALFEVKNPPALAVGLTRQEQTDFKLQLLQPLQAIFYADDEAEATYLRDYFIDEFESDQPELVVTL
jgi:hypothetical protein